MYSRAASASRADSPTRAQPTLAPFRSPRNPFWSTIRARSALTVVMSPFSVGSTIRFQKPRIAFSVWPWARSHSAKVMPSSSRRAARPRERIRVIA